MIRTLLVVLSALVVDACALFVGALIWRWWQGVPHAGGQLFCVLVFVSSAIVLRLVNEHGAWLLFPPVLGVLLLCLAPVAPVFLLLSALRRTWACVRLWHVCGARRDPRSAQPVRFGQAMTGGRGR